MASEKASIDPAKSEVVTSHKVSCNGGGGALGHPRVWMEMGGDEYAQCKYCDKRFVLKDGAHDKS